jgi:circadian clock protein KaiC
MSPRVKTGSREFDAMLNGGFLRGDAVLLAGGPGTGKTTLALQYLVSGAQAGEPGIYLTFEELPDQLYRDAKSFGWDLRRLEEEDKLRVICTSPDVMVEPSGAQLILQPTIKELGARRIVIDSLSHLSMYVEPQMMRKEIYRLVMFFKIKGLSSVLLWESPQMSGESFAVSDEGISFLVDAIVLLKYVEIQSTIRSAMTILKLRGSRHDRLLREYQIVDNGVKVLAPFDDYEGIMTGNPRRSGVEAISKGLAEAFMKRK